jgi:hypothetical protein
VCSEDDDFVGCGRPHAFPEAFLKFMIILGALVKWPTPHTELLLCPCMIALHCSRTADTERETERESDRYYYNHAGAIMQRTQTAGSNRSWDCLYCGTFGSSDTKSIVCKKCWKFQKIPFFNEPKFVKQIREESFRILWKKINFDLESSKLIKLINYSMNMCWICPCTVILGTLVF